MDISIITPVYHGNKYINSYLKSILKASDKILNNVEVILVNDSPEVKIEYDENLASKIKFRIIENKNNMGIHKSRVAGVREAKGKYILFLDQDDEITENALVTQLDIIQNGADIVLGNGIYEDGKKLNKIFANKFSQNFSIKKLPYLLARNFIISPGQCLIKKESIPEYWLNNIMQVNGADDYLLWLLMFNNNANIECNYNVIYIHKYTGENVSLNNEKMYKSQLDLIQVLEKDEEYKKRDLKKLKRAINYKHNYKNHFFIETLKNFDIFIYNVYYKILWNGYTIKSK